MNCLGEEGSHGGGDDAIVDDDAPREVLPSLLLIADLEIVKSPLAAKLLILLPLFEGIFFLADVSSVEHADRLYAIVAQHVQHLKGEVEEVVGVDVLVELKGASVAALVQPRHYVDGCCLVVE